MNEFSKNFILSVIPSSPAIYFALESPSARNVIGSVALPIILFFASKTVDVLVQIYFKRKKLS
jgi:hypothetical protein